MNTSWNGLLGLTLIMSLGCQPTEFDGSNAKKKPQVTVVDLEQKALPEIKLNFVQGFQGEAVVEAWHQDQLKLDIELVIDNSGSMGNEQTNLASKLEPLLSAVADSDWQINVTTTSAAEGCSRGIVHKSDSDPVSKFASAINAGINGAPNERGVYQALQGLKCTPNWIRTDSVVAVLIVSDEDNCSDGACPSEDEKTGKILLDHLASIRKVGETARIYGLFSGPTTADLTGCDLSNNKISPIYNDLIQKTGGQWGSICAADFTPTLKKISEDVAKLLKGAMPLKLMPDPGSLNVLMDGKPWDSFDLDGQQIRFKEIPHIGANIEVHYKHGQNGEMRDRFALDPHHSPVVDSLKVSVNDVAVSAADVSLEKGAEGWDVHFATMPADNAAIVMTYQNQVDLPADFDVGTGYRTLQSATVAGEIVEGTYSPEKGQVHFAQAPAPGAKIQVSLER